MAAPQAQASPAVPYTPVITDLLRLIRAPFAPRGVFEEQRDAPTFWMPWIVLSVLFAVVMVFMIPVTIQGARVVAASKGTPLPPAAVTLTTVLTLVGPAIGLLIGALIGAAVLYLILMVLGASTRFKGLMTIQLFAATVTVIQTAVITVMLRMRGLEAIQSPADAQQSLGLDLVLSPEYVQAHRAIAALLRGIGPFEIWVVVLLGIGMIALEKVPSRKAWTAAVVAFIVGLLIRSGSAIVFKAG